MSLPKIKTPTFSVKLPSNNQKVIYRPFTVKEEKILLIAQESEENEDQLRAIKQIISNCILEPENLRVDQLASFDIEYLFLKLRAKSVGEIVKIQVSPQKRSDLPPMSFELNIDEIEPTFDPKHTSLIDIGEGIQIQMQYPTFEMITQLQNPESLTEMFNLFQKSIVAIYEGDTVYETKDFSNAEVSEFIESLTSNQLVKLQDFFTTLPKLQKEITYEWVDPEDPNNKYTEKVVIEGLLNFLS